MIEQRYLPNGMVITKARIQDAPAIADVIVAGSKRAYTSDEYLSRAGEAQSAVQIRHVTTPEFHASLQRRHIYRMNNVQSAVVFVARSRYGIEGVGSGEITDFGRHDLESLYTRNPGNGAGTSLLDVVNEWQLEHGADHSFVQVATWTPAIHFYERKGYTFCGAGTVKWRIDEVRNYIHLTSMRTALPRQPGTCFFDRHKIFAA